MLHDTGYGFGIYLGHHDIAGAPAHYFFTVSFASALLFYAAPAIIAAAVIWTMAYRPNASFNTLRESLSVGGSAGLILLAAGFAFNMASYARTILSALWTAGNMTAFFAPFIIAIGVVTAAVLAVRIIRARRAKDAAVPGALC